MRRLGMETGGITRLKRVQHPGYRSLNPSGSFGANRIPAGLDFP